MRPCSLHEVARRRVSAPDRPLWLPLGEFLDEFYAEDADRFGMLRDPLPGGLRREEAAYLAAAAEHLSLLYRLEPPTWVCEPAYFLDVAYWPESHGPAFEAVCLAESPISFRRRFIFTEGRPLRRKAGPVRPAA